MPEVALHGTTIAWTIEDLPGDPLAEVFSMLARAPAGEPSVRFALRPAQAPASRDPRDEGWEPSFFHGVVQAYRGARGFLIWDRASRIHVPQEGVIEAEIAPPDREVVPGSIGAALQIALALALRPRGLFHLHAAALVHPSGAGVLVIGGSGAGKTTTTLALLEAGAAYLGDDTLFLTAGSPVEVVAFPREFHLGPATLASFPRLLPLAGPPSARGDKRPLDPRIAYPGRHRAALTPEPGRTLALFPSITAAPLTETAPLAKADAFGYLLASSAALVIEGAAGRADNHALLAALLGAARCHEIRLGADALAVPAAISRRIDAVLAAA